MELSSIGQDKVIRPHRAPPGIPAVSSALPDRRETGSKLFERYREEGPVALADRSRRPVRYANQLPAQVESLIVT